MNVYFLVEGRRTEMKVYPQWLSHCVPELKRVQHFNEVTKNNYFIFSGNGYPSLLDVHLPNCIGDINDNGNYDYFVICLDADEQNIEDCQKEIIAFITKNDIRLTKNTKLEIIVQNRCLETWFLGNPKIFKKNPSRDFLKHCTTFYDVKKEDPELMGKLSQFEGSISQFHASYLQELLAERNITYTKKNPQAVIEKYYLDELILRSQKTKHLASFQNFIAFCNEIQREIHQSRQ
jgi:hypothetical protein